VTVDADGDFAAGAGSDWLTEQPVAQRAARTTPAAAMIAARGRPRRPATAPDGRGESQLLQYIAPLTMRRNERQAATYMPAEPVENKVTQKP
jgi:hypothetical protein